MIASALCGMAENMTQLIIYRGLQGIGGGVLMPMAMIVVGDLFTGAQRAKFQGVFGAIFRPCFGYWTANWRLDCRRLELEVGIFILTSLLELLRLF
ncbi:hypothetical protein GCM10020331_042200 [Ectobacillus funiculus]